MRQAVGLVYDNKTHQIFETEEFEKYLEDIRMFFADWGWVLPYPNDYEF